MREGASDSRHRRAPRLTTRLSGSLVGRTRLEVEILDLSLTGCLVRCSVLLDRGLIMDLTLDIEGATFAAKVRVAEASRDGQSGSEGGLCLIGLEFLALPAQGEQLLLSFLQRERRRRQSEA